VGVSISSILVSGLSVLDSPDFAAELAYGERLVEPAVLEIQVTAVAMCSTDRASTFDN